MWHKIQASLLMPYSGGVLMAGTASFTKSFVAIFILVGVAAGFALILRNIPSPPPEPGSESSSYPGPEANNPEVVQQMDPYPALTNSTSSSSCTENNTWTTYTNASIGYAVDIPTSSRFGTVIATTGFENAFIFLATDCTPCTHSTVRMDIRTFENLGNLPIQDFVEQHFIDKSIARGESATWVNSFDIFEYGAEYIQLTDTQGIRIQDTNRSYESVQKIGVDNPMVFVPYGNFVLAFSISPNDPELPLNPCSSVITTFDKVVDSLQLTNSGQ
jgi:hypothetical protein